MMFRGQKVADALSIFKWKWRSESSLTTGLLNDVPPEIELSDYRRIPSPGSESPSTLLNGESRNEEPITDLDLFFERLYNYYCEKGLWCIIIKWIVELLSLGFTICFSAFVLLFVDWNGLRNAKCGMDAVESGIKPCDLSKEALHQHPLTPFTLSKAIIVGYLGIFSVYWIFCFLRFFAQLKETLGIRHFYYNSLHVTDNEIQTIPWASILEKVVESQSSQQLCVVKDLSAHDVVMRLMRKENYLIGMLNKGVLAFPISCWVPGAGPAVKFSSSGVQHHLILTKTLEWTLNWCILQSMFDRNFCVRRDFISNPKALKKRLMVVGIVMLLLSPFLVIFTLVFCFLRHAEQFYNHPTTASSRRWSNLSKWIFREFNEVDHLFKHRINSSVVHASDYLKQFPAPILSIIAKFISFVFGGFAAVLIFIAFLEESLLEGHIFGRNLFWYAAVFGTITAISRAAVTDELLVLDPEGAMSLVVQHTHYLPKRWRGKENSELVRIEFETLFQYTGMMLLEEIASIFLTPYLLLFVVPKRVDDILQFIADFTVHVEGVGHVCSFSVFDFQSHGNSNYGSPHNSSRSQRSSQGKMEKSFLSFQSSYPSWDPDAQGKQFLSILRTFREEKLQGHGTRPTYLPARIWRGPQNLQFQMDRNGFFSREMQNSPGIGYHPGSLWVIDAELKSHPYLLDWYYTSRPQQENGNSNHISRVPYEVAEEQPKDFWMPTNFSQREVRYDGDFWHQHFHDRTQSHLEASTSEPFFQESVLQHHDSSHVSHPAKSRWWARSGAHGADTQTSFLEPPDFNQHTRYDYHDNFSDKNPDEEQGQDLDWRNSRRSYGHEHHEQQLDLKKSHKSPDHEQHHLYLKEAHKSLDHEQLLDWRDSHESRDHDRDLDWRGAHKSLDHQQLLDWRDPQKSRDHEGDLVWSKGRKSLDLEQPFESRDSSKLGDHESDLDWRGAHKPLDLEQLVEARDSHKPHWDWRHWRKSSSREQHQHSDWRDPHRSLDLEQQHLDWREPHKSLDHEQHLDWRESHNSPGQEQQVEWRNYHPTPDEDQQDEELSAWRNPNEPLARTMFMDFDVGDYQLHFDDIYRRSPGEAMHENPDPWSS